MPKISEEEKLWLKEEEKVENLVYMIVLNQDAVLFFVE